MSAPGRDSERPSDLADLISGRLLLRALDDMHEVAQAAKELPAMIEQLSQAVEATREVVALANAAIDRANASAELLGQMTEPILGAAGQLARLLDRLPGRSSLSQLSAALQPQAQPRAPASPPGEAGGEGQS